MKCFPAVSLSIALACQTLLFSAPVLSQETGQPAQLPEEERLRQKEAREHYGRGKEFFDRGNYTEALKQFQMAYDLSPHPVVLKSIGECQVRTDDVLSSKNLNGFTKIKSGLYRTDGFDEAGKKIFIEIDCGVSSINIGRYKE